MTPLSILTLQFFAVVKYVYCDRLKMTLSFHFPVSKCYGLDDVDGISFQSPRYSLEIIFYREL